MDDLKLFAEAVQRLYHLLQLVTVFCNDIRMKFGIDKCWSIHLHQRQVVDSSSCRVNNTRVFEGEAYKHKLSGFPQI